MDLEAAEIGRLAISQHRAAHFVERRVERAELIDDYHYTVAVTQQFTTPIHDPDESLDPKVLLVSLGWFPKYRLPDLTVMDQAGSTLPLLRRTDQGRVMATIITNRWYATFFRGVSEESSEIAESIWRIINTAVAQVVTSSRRGAFVAVYRLERYLEDCVADAELAPDVRDAVSRLLSRKRFWGYLTDVLTESRLLVAKMEGRPGRTHVITITYTERFPYKSYGKEPSRLSKALAWLGLIGMPTSRVVANIGHAASLWAIQSVPEGLEPVRCFWKGEAADTHPTDPISVDISSAAAGKHVSHSSEVAKPDDLILDVQISPSPAIASTVALAALIYLVSVYVFKAVPPHGSSEADPTILITLGSLFSATPAAIAGALAYRGHTFVRHASTGPRMLLACLSGSAATLAIIVSLHGLHGKLAESLAFLTSVYSLMLVGLFLYIRVGSRWRRTERSRRPDKTAETSPLDCRAKQQRDAVVWLTGWMVVVFIASWLLIELRTEHVFGNRFPTDVIHVFGSTVAHSR
jgi:hypothetical protein